MDLPSKEGLKEALYRRAWRYFMVHYRHSSTSNTGIGYGYQVICIILAIAVAVGFGLASLIDGMLSGIVMAAVAVAVLILWLITVIDKIVSLFFQARDFANLVVKSTDDPDEIETIFDETYPWLFRS